MTAKIQLLQNSFQFYKVPDFTDRTAKIVNENQLVKIHTDTTDLLLKDFSI